MRWSCRRARLEEGLTGVKPPTCFNGAACSPPATINLTWHEGGVKQTGALSFHEAWKKMDVRLALIQDTSNRSWPVDDFNSDGAVDEKDYWPVFITQKPIELICNPQFALFPGEQCRTHLPARTPTPSRPYDHFYLPTVYWEYRMIETLFARNNLDSRIHKLTADARRMWDRSVQGYTQGIKAGDWAIPASGDGSVSTGSAQIASVAPGLFAADASGRGLAAAVVFRVKADGSQSYEPVAQFDAAQGKFVALPIDLGPETDHPMTSGGLS